MPWQYGPVYRIDIVHKFYLAEIIIRTKMMALFSAVIGGVDSQA